MADNRFEKAIAYGSPIKANFDGGLIRAVDVIDEAKGKLQSVINSELETKITTASGNTYSKTEIDNKDASTLTSAKGYTDTAKSDAISTASTDATTKANKALADAKTYADQKVANLGSVYTIKGNITAAALKALTSAKSGDVYNLTDAVTINGKAYPAGTNVVCVTAFSAAIDPATTSNWDALAGLQDLSGYILKEDSKYFVSGMLSFEQSSQDTATQVGFNIQYLHGIDGEEMTDTDGIVINSATTSAAGVMSAADKTKLDGLKNYTLPTASDSVLGGVKIGSGITNTNGVISVPTNTFANGTAITASANGTQFKFNLAYDTTYMTVNSSNQLALNLTALKGDSNGSALGITKLESRVTALEQLLTLA